MREVEVDAVPLDRLAVLVDAERAVRIGRYAERARTMLHGRTVWNVNATAQGGGVAEMLHALLAYGRGVGVDTRWLVVDGTPDFFRLTKRLHNQLHGSPGDSGPIGDVERAVYDSVLGVNLVQLRTLVQPGDIVLLHDPQTVGLVTGLREVGAHVAWRCHVGRDETNEHTDAAWAFLRPYVEQADATVFSRRAFAPAWTDPTGVWVIPPSLDPFTAKNAELALPEVEAALRHTGILGDGEGHGDLAFVRRHGARGVVRSHVHLMGAGGPVPPGARVVLQVSRWDRLKDMAGVLTAFATHLPRLPADVHLVLVGPDVSGVSDDPEGALVLAECEKLWSEQDEETRARIHLCSLPMDDIDENAHLVNALQRHATVVVQKSLEEGFGLTVTEPMWKGKPVVASAVGGIQDQIIDGESGLLLEDPADLDAFVDRLLEVLEDEELGVRLGTAARARVRDRFLGDRHLIQYVDLFAALLGVPPDPVA